MPNFKYKARDQFSRPVSGILVATDKDEAARKLKEMAYAPISFQQIEEIGAQGFFTGFRKVKLSELNSFTRQLYSLQKAGLTLLGSLLAIAEETKNKYFRSVIEEVARNIRGGLSFSDSLKKYNKIFDDIYIGMIKAAEIGGDMAAALDRMIVLIEREMDTRSKILSATLYPMIAFWVLCMGFLILVTFVIPRFAYVYGQLNTSLPIPTLIMIAIGVGVKKYWFLILILSFLAIFAFIHFINTKIGRAKWDNLKLKFPIFGTLVTMLSMSRFARITSVLMKSGVPVLDVLDLAAATAGNVIITRAIKNIKESVNQGRGISEPMKISGLFPAAVVQMVAVGEQTGNIDELLMSVSDYYDREAGYMIKNLTTFIEPLLIFVLAMMVLLMLLAIFLPMWNLVRVYKPA